MDWTSVVYWLRLTMIIIDAYTQEKFIMSDGKLRAGIIGLGVGQSHAKGYLSSPDTELVAVCDANETRLNEWADLWKIEKRYTDYTQMLDDANLDIVSVCLPNALHAAASIAALDRGVHVVCEKPMAQTVTEAEQMVEAAARNGRRLMVAYNYRYRPDSQWMYRMVQSGKLGTIYHVSASWRRETGIPGWGWFGSKQMSGGGALIDLGVHVLDLGLWMMGFPKVKTVSGDTRMFFGPKSLKTWGRRPGQTFEGGFDVEDGGVGFIRLANGANMVLNVTWAEHVQPQEDAIRVEIQGTEGTAVLHIRNYKNDDTLRFYTEIEGEPVTVIPSIRFGAPQNHEGLIHDLASSLRQGTEPATNGSQGSTAVHILEALYQSAANGREVAFEES
jgi:predicted dehydrogenase